MKLISRNAEHVVTECGLEGVEWGLLEEEVGFGVMERLFMTGVGGSTHPSKGYPPLYCQPGGGGIFGGPFG